jgi:hypothetical protein
VKTQNGEGQREVECDSQVPMHTTLGYINFEYIQQMVDFKREGMNKYDPQIKC